MLQTKTLGRVVLAAAIVTGTGAAVSTWSAFGADAPAGAKSPESKPADAAKAVGKVTGTVVGVDGKTSVAGAKIRLLTPQAAKPRKAAAADATAAAGKGGNKVEAVAETEADAEGRFTLADVPAGQYVVVARLKGEGNARAQVSVTAGEAAKVSLTLKSPPAKAGAAKLESKKAEPK